MTTETKRIFIPAKYADLVLPSSCYLSHPEIRYTGDRCPLCEALAALHRIRDCNPVHMIGEDWAWRQIAVRALSRPSSAPGDGEAKS